MARKPKAEEPAGPPAPLTDAEIVLVAAAEAEVRERARAERVRASGSLLDEALFRPGPGDAIGRASEVLPGEDAEFSEARTVAEVFNQTWCPDSIDVMLNCRLEFLGVGGSIPRARIEKLGIVGAKDRAPDCVGLRHREQVGCEGVFPLPLAAVHRNERVPILV